MRNKTSLKVFSILCVAILLFPFAVQTAHALNGHTHKICTAKDIKHLHKKGIDCRVYHLNIQQQFVVFFTDVTIEITPVFEHAPSCFYKQEVSNYYSFNASRAPPYIVI